MDLHNLSFTELKSLHEEIMSAIEQRQAAERAEARKQILELAKAYGLSLNDVLGKGASAMRKPVEARYKNPDNESQTWTGRGRKPVWVQALLNEGFSLEDLAV